MRLIRGYRDVSKRGMSDFLIFLAYSIPSLVILILMNDHNSSDFMQGWELGSFRPNPALFSYSKTPKNKNIRI